MKHGVVIFPTDRTIQPVELAIAVEERGFESLWFPEHSHIPSSRATPWGGRDGAPPLPEEYRRTHDQFIALTAAAAVTSNINLGTGITLVAQRDPVWLAKEIASLDVISGGRFLFGVGYGWNKEEMAAHGVAYVERRAIVREKILAMIEIWTTDEWSFSGEHVNLEPSWSWPKPVQRPHPPIILGSAPGPKSFAHLLEFADGWMPLGGRHSLEQGLNLLADACAQSERDATSFEISQFGAKPERDYLQHLEALGVHRVIYKLGSPDGNMHTKQVVDQLDELAKLIE